MWTIYFRFTIIFEKYNGSEVNAFLVNRCFYTPHTIHDSQYIYYLINCSIILIHHRSHIMFVKLHYLNYIRDNVSPTVSNKLLHSFYTCCVQAWVSLLYFLLYFLFFFQKIFVMCIVCVLTLHLFHLLIPCIWKLLFEALNSDLKYENVCLLFFYLPSVCFVFFLFFFALNILYNITCKSFVLFHFIIF